MDKILIGTPIHDSKEYAIRRWLKSVSEIDWDNYLLYMVDNSTTKDFSNRVHEYCKELNFNKYELLHLEDMGGREVEARRALSREKIREKLLNGNWNWWLSWECDIIVPPNAIREYFRFIPEFQVLNHNYPDRDNKDQMVGGIGFSLYRSDIIKRFSFLDGGGYGQCDKLNQNCYYSGDSWLAKRMLRNKSYKVVDFYYLFDIKHLGQLD